MSIRIKRYDIILKLTVLLAVLGCFFIANARTVKADIKFEYVAFGESDTDAVLKYKFTRTSGDTTSSISSAKISLGPVEIDLPSGKTGVGSDIIITKKELLEYFADKVNRDTTNDIASFPNGIGKITGKVSFASYKVSGADSDVKVTTGGTVGGYADDLTICSASAASADPTDEGTTVRVEVASGDADKAVKEANDIIYGYPGAKIEFYVTGAANNRRLSSWSNANSSAPGSTPTGIKPCTIAIGDDALMYRPVFASALKTIELIPSPEDTVFKAGDTTTTKEFNVKFKLDDGSDLGDSTVADKNFAKAVSFVRSGTDNATVTYNGDTRKLTIKLNGKETTESSVKVTVEAPNAYGDNGKYTHDDKPYEFPIRKAFDSANTKVITIDGDKECAKGSDAGPYYIKYDGDYFPLEDIKEWRWTITKGTSTVDGMTFPGYDIDTSYVAKTDFPYVMSFGNATRYPDVGYTYILKVTAKDYFDTPKSAELTIRIIEPSLELVVNGLEVTKGFYLRADADDVPPGSLFGETVTFSAKNGVSISKQDKAKWYAVIQGSSVTKVDGDGATVTAKASNGTEDSVEGISVYASPLDSSYNESSRTLTIQLPSPINLGTVNAKGEAIEDVSYDFVTGYKVEISKDDKSLISSSSSSAYNKPNARKGNEKTNFSATISSSVFEKIVTDNGSGTKSVFSNNKDSMNVSVYFYGSDDSDDDDAELIENPLTKKDLVKTFEVPVYKVTWQSSASSSSTAYGLLGQSIEITAPTTFSSSQKFLRWNDGNSSTKRTITVDSDTSKNKYSVETTGTGSSSSSSSSSNTPSSQAGSGNGYDDVPKTSESNAPFWLIIFMVFAVVGSGYALYMQLKPAEAQNDSYDEEDEE